VPFVLVHPLGSYERREHAPRRTDGIARLPAEGRGQRLDVLTANAEIEGIRAVLTIGVDVDAHIFEASRGTTGETGDVEVVANAQAGREVGAAGRAVGRPRALDIPLRVVVVPSIRHDAVDVQSLQDVVGSVR